LPDEDWFIALHAPYFDRVEYSSKDMYLLHSLAPGESRSFEGWLQVGSSGSLAPVVAAEIERGGMEAGTLSGQIGSAEGPVDDSVLVIEKEGTLPFAVTDSEGAPLDARIEIAEGQAPLVEFLGRRGRLVRSRPAPPCRPAGRDDAERERIGIEMTPGRRELDRRDERHVPAFGDLG
jgi:hypothetical protein